MPDKNGAIHEKAVPGNCAPSQTVIADSWATECYLFELLVVNQRAGFHEFQSVPFSYDAGKRMSGQIDCNIRAASARTVKMS